jgi:vacuolar-type H+-ATPase subunit I/STV1
LKFKSSLVRHLKVCKVKKTNLEKELDLKDIKVKELEKENEILKAIASKPSIGTQNNLKINLTAYNNPNLEDIEKHLKDSVKKIFMAVPTLIEKIHFNENNPENHNIVIKNDRTKLAKVFNVINEEELLNELVDTCESLLSEYANENGNKYNEKMNIIKNRDTEEKVYDDMKVEVKKVLYDNRDMIKIKN